MGAFDDLVPAGGSGGGSFDDLIPQEASPSMLGRAHQEGWNALKSAFSDIGNALNPAGKKPEDYLGPSGMLRSAGDVGGALLGGATALGAYPMAAATSLGASLASPALRGTEGAIASGIDRLSPEYAASLRKNIPTDEQAYEALKPGVSAALSGIAAPAFSRKLPMAPSKGPVPTTGELLDTFGQAKRAPELATEISPESAASNIGAIRAKLKDELHPTTGDTQSVLNQLEELAQGDSPLTMGHLNSANQRLNEVIRGGGRDASAALTTKPMLDEWVKGLAEGTPAPASGTVRLYHGGQTETLEGGGGRWVTPDEKYARGYAGDTGKVYYTDIPESSPYLKKSYEDAGTSQKAPYAAFEAPEDIARNLKPLQQSGVLSGDPAAAQGIMQDARANYTIGKAAEGLEKRLATAERKPEPLQMQTALRTKVSQFLDSKDSQNLTLSQRAALDSFANGTATQGVLKFIGKAMGGGGGLETQVASAIGGYTGGPVGALAPFAGRGLVKLSAALTARQASKLSELLRSESPLAKQMRGPVSEWSSAAQVAQGAPTARNLSRLTLASRNLSNNLRDANIHIAPNDIMKSLFGQKPAAADSNE